LLRTLVLAPELRHMPQVVQRPADALNGRADPLLSCFLSEEQQSLFEQACRPGRVLLHDRDLAQSVERDGNAESVVQFASKREALLQPDTRSAGVVALTR